MLHSLSKLESYIPRRLDRSEREEGLREIRQKCEEAGHTLVGAVILRATVKSTVARVCYLDDSGERISAVFKIFRDLDKLENELFCLYHLSEHKLAPQVLTVGSNYLLLEDLKPKFKALDSLLQDSVSITEINKILSQVFHALGRAHAVMSHSFPPDSSAEISAPERVKKWWGNVQLPVRFGDLKLSHCFFCPAQGVRFIDFETFELGFCGLNDVYQLLSDLMTVRTADVESVGLFCSDYDLGRDSKRNYRPLEYKELLECFERSLTDDSPCL